MLEGLVASLLNRFLGMYIKNFDPKQLQVGIWNGEVTLKNLELRREALDQLKLPVNVVEGHVGNLHLVLPLSNPRGKPVKVTIDEVFLLAAPKEDAEYNEEDERKRAQAVKMEKLENAELIKERSSAGLSQEEQHKNQSFLDSLITAVVDNLQVSIKNIHIRYEDSIAAPGHPFALGITLKEFSAVSTDENWKPTFIQSSSTTTHKLATLGSLAFYWNTDAKLFGTGRGTESGAEAQGISHDELLRKFREMIDSEDNRQYMLKPVSGRAAVEVDKTGKIENPRLKARLLFQEFAFILDEDQYRDALMMVDLFHYFKRHQEYKKYRPEKSPKEDPRAWLRFAGEAVLRNIHEKNRRWTWDYMRERKEDRVKYIDLFKKKKTTQKLSADEQQSMTELEEKLTYEDLRFYRSLARSQMRKENVGVKKEEPKKQTWSQWIWGSGNSNQSTEKTEEEVPEITENDRKELYNAIDWDEKKAISESLDVPRETIKLQIESSLRTGSFTLRRDPQGAANEILSLMFDNFQAQALQRPDSMLADIKLGGLRVYDGTTEGTLFPQIVKVKDKEAVPKQTREVVDVSDDQELSEKAQDMDEDDSLFHLVVEQNPLDESADSEINLKLKAVEVIYNPQFVVEVVRFFKPPERHMESIGALMETAGATVEGLRQQTRAGLEFALQEHKTVNAHLDIQAPLIIVPESVTKESTLCLILDAGHVALNSELVDKKTMQEIQSKQKAQYNEQDFKQLEGLMYDKFLLKLDSTQVLIGPGIEATKKQVASDEEDNSYHIIDRINMNFVLETSIIPKASDLTKTRISGHLPELHASISDRKYKNLMKLIEIAIPKFDNDGSNKNDTEATSLAQSKKATEPSSRPRSKSFQVEGPVEEVLVDEDSDDEKDKVQVTKGKKTEVINLRQRNFEFKFTVDRLRGSLYRADPQNKKPDQLLVELIAEHFELNFYQRPYDMVAEVLLRSLSVDDYIENDPSPEFKKIITSQDVDKAENRDLFNLKFVRVQKDSPEFVSTYEGIAMNLDVAISTINLVVTRRTLLTLLDFVLITFASPDSAADAKAIENKTAENTSKEPNAEKETPTQQESDKIRIKVDLNSIALILNNDGIRLATLRLNTADVGVFLAGGCIRVDARLGSLSLQDDVNQGAAEGSPLRQLVAIEGDNLADFRYQTYDSKAESYPGYDSKVYLR
jgi:vacuolar protein sorting-associated protein 13A/C